MNESREAKAKRPAVWSVPLLRWIASLFTEQPSVSAKEQRFIIVYLGDSTHAGFDELTLPILLRLVEEHDPDHFIFLQTCIVAHFLSSRKRLEAVRRLLADVEALRERDARFSELKIGLAEGELIAEFDWRGRVKRDGVSPMGLANNEAAREPDYRKRFEAIERTL